MAYTLKIFKDGKEFDSAYITEQQYNKICDVLLADEEAIPEHTVYNFEIPNANLSMVDYMNLFKFDKINTYRQLKKQTETTN